MLQIVIDPRRTELQVSHDLRSTNHELKDKVEKRRDDDGANASQSMHALESGASAIWNTRHVTFTLPLPFIGWESFNHLELANHRWRRTTQKHTLYEKTTKCQINTLHPMWRSRDPSTTATIPGNVSPTNLRARPKSKPKHHLS